MSKIYYVIVSNGLPADVTTDFGMANLRRKELDSKDRPAVIIPCMPITSGTQPGFDFSEDTNPECKLCDDFGCSNCL